MSETPLSDLAATRIRQLRAARGLNRDALAKLVGHGMTAAAITNIETGRRSPDGARRRELTIDELSWFAAALGLRSDELLSDTCARCAGAPPAGFACLGCGAGGR